MLYTAVKTNSVAIRELLEGDDSHGNRVYTVMVNSEEKTKKSKCDSFLGMFVVSLSLLKAFSCTKWMEKKELAEQEAVKSLKAFRWRDYWQCSSACVVSLGDSSFGEEEVGEKEDMGNDKENNMLYGYEKPELSTVQILLQQSVAKDLTELEA
ncbi:hypothetical protein Bca101_085156 [Brassica carinata]